MAHPLGGQCQAVSKATGQRCRLRAQHVGQRRTTLDGDRDAVDEARQRTQRGSLRDALQRLDEAGSRPRVGESAAQLAGQLAGADACDSYPFLWMAPTRLQRVTVGTARLVGRGP